MAAQRWFTQALAVLASSLLALVVGCSGDTGADGSSCTVVEDDAGGATIECDDGTSVTVPGGEDGANCTVTDNGDGTKTISCDDGTEVTVEDGADGTDGTDIPPDTLDDILDRLDEASNVEPESCAVCHSGAGQDHQDIYDAYMDESDLALTIDSVTASDGDSDGDYEVVLTFSITKGGFPYLDLDGLPSLEQKRFIAVTYDSSTMLHDEGGEYLHNDIVALGGGQYRATTDDVAFDPTTDGFVYGYIADGPLHTEPAGHVHLYEDVSNTAMVFGDAATTPYESPANVSGCAKCHGDPYMKHGYRAAEVEGLGDFAACKTCHYDTRSGGHEDWQILVEDPARFADIHGGADLTAAEEARFAYTANIMNDVHMSHAMEFPYPQSMANCATCHEGKLDMIQEVEDFVVETCISCHAWSGDETYGTAEHSLQAIWDRGGVGSLHSWTEPSAAPTCNGSGCHDTISASKTDLTDLHNGGYDPQIYSAAGTVRYNEVFTVSVDSASFDSSSNILTIGFSATEVGGAGTVTEFDVDDIVPTVLVGLYGYDTKDFIVAAHGRDEDRNRLLEFAVDGTTTNPRFEVVSSSAGSWEITADLSMWSTMIADGTIRRAELGVMPGITSVVGDEDVDVGSCDPACGRGTYCDSSDTCVEDDDYMLALDAPSRTFDLGANDFDDDFYADIVEVQSCNTCHDALATTFHSGNRGGNIRVCRTCHVTLNGGSHLEMQSRSIDSYVHAVHSFQAFDIGDIDFSDSVEAVRYDLHIGHTFPNFTINNCESCHNPGTYGPPNQAASLPGILSGSDEVADRNIGDVPAVVTGPGARACGGCHRAEYINQDDASGLSAFYGHTDTNGYVVEDGDGVLDVVISEIMSYFYE